MRVGTRLQARAYKILAKDHPHACGDKLSLYDVKSIGQGSSPCVWGQVSSLGFPIACCRIIPMRVGTRALSASVRLLSEDHPHACGDKFLRLCSRC